MSLVDHVDEDILKALIVPFNRKGVEELNKKEFLFAYSLDLDWFSFEESKELLKYGLNNAILEKEKNKVRLNSEIEEIDVHHAFEPSEGLIERVKSENNSLFQEIIERIRKEKGIGKKKIFSSINDIQEELDKLVDVETAGLVLCEELDVEVNDLREQKIKALKK
ncbi:MAG: putative HTH domain homologous to N-terminal domain of RPA1 protein family [Candidatus Methanohalarchaeum thermophilum]|uniref:HTH domain homologous to N-terminal domain of RPA1 protein family n=1 Tax=Methanohalarchaeum thermophilum TaxID=1903181 RepID=A0A1Q6DXS7_METT1|nr:MAG: putative HTH domain homologous to N-terminal domain of RPA1 protein family [Candidatus Methanohalarchaeum thermophilum]